MIARHFTLQPFPGTGPLPGLEITGHIIRQANTLAIGFVLFDPLKELEIPEPADLPARKIGLWEKTCFEFFIAERNAPRYWEFNLSPSGDWNVYRFEAYRQGLYEEMAFSTLPFSALRQSDSLQLILEFDLGLIIPADKALEVAISVVIKTKGGEESFWALTHPGSKPDFHWRKSFIVKL
jgi:hypothetical protein